MARQSSRMANSPSGPENLRMIGVDCSSTEHATVADIVIVGYLAPAFRTTSVKW
jgi:hypothetical protein